MEKLAKSIGVRLDHDRAELLLKAAEDSRKGPSTLAREIISDWIDHHSKNKQTKLFDTRTPPKYQRIRFNKKTNTLSCPTPNDPNYNLEIETFEGHEKLLYELLKLEDKGVSAPQIIDVIGHAAAILDARYSISNKTDLKAAERGPKYGGNSDAKAS